ncbi:MAG: tRNA preQ1(34) S-adenosylmethionine ribosyltransferase-isomerase QueA [Anaerovoracaceae bacterium]|jgi:S-adenosylmethionine:tRNA ribosyltransferase-isomerase|nr:tRNA preQ1(34) S-adenosylmethionine ribosyltransferase-isomerase QueA [Bacillota bacterium]HPZ60320.1 tRNA preQ1(34) S-adenosylmethionine ribosyltransferase-isomerase QueA [Bacillota bacterium]
MHINEFDYELPVDLIAQYPAEKRENARLMVIHRDSGTIEHRRFYDILDYLSPGDCLVMNNSKVLPARLIGNKETTGIEVEFLLLKRKQGDVWEAMVRPGRRLKPGDRVRFSEEPLLSATILDYGDDGTRIVEFKYEGIFLEILEKVGRMPLPPYIQRESGERDRERYQTVYCKIEGSVAAPTAGLHFTGELLDRIKAKGVHLAYVTLHVGIGTFRPVKCENIEEHRMHFEEYWIDEETADLINKTKASGGKIFSVGTTSTRTLESAASEDGTIKAGHGNTDIFIYPGFKFRVIDSQITNFHLPKSTLLMLVSAFYDREKILEAYKLAVKERYRFFSYGDAMLLL